MKEMHGALKFIITRFQFRSEQQIDQVEKRWEVANLPTQNVFAMLIPRMHIYFVGPSSTGKTTLMNDLKKRIEEIRLQKLKRQIEVKVVSEIGRNVCKDRGVSGADMKEDSELAISVQKEIWSRQVQKERELEGEFVLVDRSGIDPLFYAQTLGNMDNDSFREELNDEAQFQQMLGRYRSKSQSLIFLVKPVDADVTMKRDGMRALPGKVEEWFQDAERYEQLLNHFKIPFFPIDSLDREQRVNTILGEISRQCKESY